jgi:hypothetical protein
MKKELHEAFLEGAAHALPTSASSLTIVFLATPVILTVDLIELPSTSAAITCACFILSNLFIL